MTGSLVLLATQARALDELLPCRRQNAQLWFSDLPAELQLAKAYCQPCPVRRVCLTGAVERKSMLPAVGPATRAIDGVVDVEVQLSYGIDDTRLPTVPVSCPTR